MFPKHLVYGLSIAAIISTLPCVAANFDDDQSLSTHSFLSLSGSTGLIRMPSAEVTPHGEFRAGYFSSRQSDIISQYGNSTTYGATFGMFPGLDFGFDVGNLRQRTDLTANAKYQLIHEHSFTPNVTFGVFEASKLNTSNAYYLAVGKHFLSDRLNLTAGLVKRSDLGTKPYGGIEFALFPFLDAVGERDIDTINYGLRAHFRGLSAMLEHRKTGLGVIAGFTAPLSNRLKPVANTSVTDEPMTDKATSNTVARSVLSAVLETGVENVKVAVNAKSSGVIAVEYENRVFMHSEIDAFCAVLRAISTVAPRQISNFEVTILRSSTPTITIGIPSQAYRQFTIGFMGNEEFGQQLTFKRGKSDISRSGFEVISGKSNFGKSDLTIRPSVSTEVGTDNAVLAGGLDPRPEVITPIFKGINTDIRATIQGVGPLRHKPSEFDRLAVSSLVNIGDSFIRASAGRFPGRWAGGVLEGVISPINSNLQGRLLFSSLRQNDVFITHSTSLVGFLREYVPSLDTSIYGGYGKYLQLDTGFTVGLSRRFGDTDFGVEYRNTNLDHIGMLTLGIPLGPNKINNKAAVVRVKPPDFLDYVQRVGLNDPNFIGTTNATGNIVSTGSFITNDILDRDRLNKAYILRSLERLKATQQ